MNRFMELALREAKKADKKKEVPIGGTLYTAGTDRGREGEGL